MSASSQRGSVGDRYLLCSRTRPLICLARGGGVTSRPWMTHPPAHSLHFGRRRLGGERGSGRRARVWEATDCLSLRTPAVPPHLRCFPLAWPGAAVVLLVLQMRPSALGSPAARKDFHDPPGLEPATSLISPEALPWSLIATVFSRFLRLTFSPLFLPFVPFPLGLMAVMPPWSLVPLLLASDVLLESGRTS